MHARASQIALFLAFLAAFPGRALQQARSVGAGNTGALAPTQRTFTLKAENLPVSSVLKTLGEQTGIAVLDRRREKADRRVTMDFDRVPFWQGVDRLVAATHSGLSLYQPEGSIALVDGPYRQPPVSYSGVFRTALKQISLSRDLEENSHFCHFQIEVAWEPAFQPFYLDPRIITVVYGPDRTGAERAVKQPGKGQIPVTGRIVTDLEVHLPAPDRSVAAVKSLAGSFSVIGPMKMLTFEFADLKTVPVAKVQEGISASLSDFSADEDHWTAKVALKYPSGGPHFESYQSWLGNNKIVLQKKNGSQRWRPAGERILKLTSDQAVIEYYFENASGKDVADWRLIYDTPGPIVQVSASFHFKDVPLP
jgi:hypothetical protein